MADFKTTLERLSTAATEPVDTRPASLEEAAILGADTDDGSWAAYELALVHAERGELACAVAEYLNEFAADRAK